MNKVVKFILCVVVCEAAGIIGSIFTFSSITTWYATLNKPFLNPPAFLFGPVWTILYFLMGVALFRVLNKKKANVSIFWIQLGLNAIWSPIFFGLKNPALAFGEILLLWVAIAETIKIFSKIDKTSAFLLYPYLAWVSFATILNLSIVILNK